METVYEEFVDGFTLMVEVPVYKKLVVLPDHIVAEAPPVNVMFPVAN